ncbi:MAG: hypothetical protein LBV27_04940 [Oscillospiraceae bacterium]|nr:hypothetical protein [Oscillospiraceae bacterium]
MKYLRKVLCDVDEGISLPHTLSAEALRSSIESINIEPEPHVAWSAFSFLRSKVFSLQSAVSYALALVLLVAVAYGMRLGSNVVDGSIMIENQTAAHTAETGAARTARSPENAADKPVYAEDDTIAGGGGAKTSSDASTAGSNTQADQQPETFGVGGGAEAVYLGEDEQYVYLYRMNDLTDPDKASMPMTIEIVGTADGAPAGLIDLPDISKIIKFYSIPGFIGLVGEHDGVVVARGYALGNIADGNKASEVFTAAQPGRYENSHQIDGILHVVTLADEEDAGDDMAVQPLPGATSTALCVITAVDMQQGAVRQEAFLGADKGVSMHERNIYISYMAQHEGEDEQELSMAQIRLDGTDFEMVMVP